MINKLKYAFAVAMNPYKILNLGHTATTSEIKQAYYKLAHEYHPDKNQAKDAAKKFTQINEAYEILMDQNKRQMYDSCHYEEEETEYQEYTTSKKQKRKKKEYYQKNFDYEAIFEEFDIFFQQKHGKRKSFKKKGEDIKQTLNISFIESIFGVKNAHIQKLKTTKSIELQKLMTCESCNGTRAAPGYEPQKCYTCGGSGRLQYLDEGSLFETQCSKCNGLGKVIKSYCTSCDGHGVKQKQVSEKLEIPKGVTTGQIMRKQISYFNSIKSNTGGDNGDLLVKIQVEEDPDMKKEGHNIISNIHLSDAIRQFKPSGVRWRQTQKSKFGQNCQVQIPGLQQPHTKIQIPQQGIQYGNASWKRGDHIVVLQLRVPTDLDEKTKQLFQELKEVQ